MKIHFGTQEYHEYQHYVAEKCEDLIITSPLCLPEAIRATM